jgi:hypothetical protein
MIECILQGSKGPQLFLVGTQRILIGRDPAADVWVDDESVSRRHAELYSHNGGVVVADLGSCNGTFLNGSQVSNAVLFSADELKIGGVKFRFFRSDQSSPLSQAEGIFFELRQRLEILLPPGITLDRDTCLGVLQILIREGHERTFIISRFLKEAASNPMRFNKSPSEHLMERARNIFQQLQKALSDKLPRGCSLDENACLEHFAEGLKKLAPEEMIPDFFSKLKADPRRYLHGLPDPKHAYQFNSGAPSYPSRSECRR